jgi:hypothetical protein
MGQVVANTTKKKKTRIRQLKLAIRKRWVQLCVMLLAGLLVMLLSVLILKPKVIPKEDTSQFKFMHCTVCSLELPYNKDIAEKRCAKCVGAKVGFFVPTTESVKKGGLLDPWRWVYSALFIETLVLLSSVVYLLYLPVTDPTKVFYVLTCPHCSQKLRYRAVSLGGIGSCSRCKRMLRFPEEDDAILEADVLKAEQQAVIAEHQRLQEEEKAVE